MKNDFFDSIGQLHASGAADTGHQNNPGSMRTQPQ
jgi:hypothetical protein